MMKKTIYNQNPFTRTRKNGKQHNFSKKRKLDDTQVVVDSTTTETQHFDTQDENLNQLITQIQTTTDHKSPIFIINHAPEVQYDVNTDDTTSDEYSQ